MIEVSYYKIHLCLKEGFPSGTGQAIRGGGGSLCRLVGRRAPGEARPEPVEGRAHRHLELGSQGLRTGTGEERTPRATSYIQKPEPNPVAGPPLSPDYSVDEAASSAAEKLGRFLRRANA